MTSLPGYSSAIPRAGSGASARRSLHIPTLDGLRAGSFLLVFAAHAGLEHVLPGGFGVTIFFFLSGYLITTLLRVEERETGRINLGHFYLRRALRILPPFYIVLFAAIILAITGIVRPETPPRVSPITAELLHISNYWIAFHGWAGIPTGTGVYWSLAVEEHFYLLFPTIYLALCHFKVTDKTKAYLFWSACAVVLLWRCVLVGILHVSTDRTFLCSDTRIDSIAFGCALACWTNPVLDGSDVRKGGGTLGNGVFWRSILFPAAVALLLATFIIRGSFFRDAIRFTLQGIALTPVFATAVRWPEWFVFRPLQWRPMRVLGALSYSLYLVHQVVLAFIADQTPLSSTARALVALIISLAIAAAMYRFVEKPCAILRKRVSESR